MSDSFSTASTDRKRLEHAHVEARRRLRATLSGLATVALAETSLIDASKHDPEAVDPARGRRRLEPAVAAVEEARQLAVAALVALETHRARTPDGS